MGNKRNRNRERPSDPSLLTIEQSVQRFGTVYLSHQAIRQSIGVGRPIMVDDTLIGFDGDVDVGINMTYYGMMLPKDFQRTFDRFVMPVLQNETTRILSGQKMSRSEVLDQIAELCERIFVPRVGFKTQDPKAVTKLRGPGITQHAFEIMASLEGPAIMQGVRFASPDDPPDDDAVIDVEACDVEDSAPSEEEMLENFEFPESILKAQAAGPFPCWFMIGELLAAAVNGWSYAKYYDHVSGDHPNEPIESMECLLGGTEPAVMRETLPVILAQSVTALVEKFLHEQSGPVWKTLSAESRARQVQEYSCDILSDALARARRS